MALDLALIALGLVLMVLTFLLIMRPAKVRFRASVARVVSLEMELQKWQ